MSKIVVFPNATAANAVLTRTRNAGNAVASRAAHIGSNVAHLVPATWNGTGRVPPGWTVPYGLETEAGGKRVAIVVDDDFARDKPDFAAAVDKIPDDWDRGGGPGQAGANPKAEAPVNGGGR